VDEQMEIEDGPNVPKPKTGIGYYLSTWTIQFTARAAREAASPARRMNRNQNRL